jgi:hypothetical protein
MQPLGGFEFVSGHAIRRAEKLVLGHAASAAVSEAEAKADY